MINSLVIASFVLGIILIKKTSSQLKMKKAITISDQKQALIYR